MPIFSFNLSQKSDVLVGSITWFLIYLSSEAEWIDAINKDEHDAIMYGIDVLNYFINGELSQVSKSKIEIGMKFCMLYLNKNINYQDLPEFKEAWNIIRHELVGRVNLSADFVKEIKVIISGMKKVKNKFWHSMGEFADQLLVEYCKTQDPMLYHNITGKITIIDKPQFINSVEEQAWCLIKIANKYYSIKIPTVRKRYNSLIQSVVDLNKKINKLFIKNNFIQSDYFNPSLDGDDIAFIYSATLDIVSLQLTEYRYVQEKLIGPPLKKIQKKENYIFFRASDLGKEKIYALDTRHKKRMQKVKIGSKNLIEDVEEFFDGWSDYKGNLINIVAYKDHNVNISISKQEPFSFFIDKVVEWQDKIIEDLIYKQTAEGMRTRDVILNVMKDLFIPFHSCVTSLQGHDATDAFISCFLDGVFILFPAGRKIFSINKKITDRFINMSFTVKKNKIFRSDSRIIWSKVINDFYVYNTILNEQTMLRISVVDLLFSSIDPGIGLMKDIKKLAFNTVSKIIKGELIRLPLASIWHMKSIAEFSVRTNVIFDSSKKIVVKISKPSGRFTIDHYYRDSRNGTFISSLYDATYQFGDYYAYFSNKEYVDILLGMTEETTKDDERIYVILSEDQYNGIIFRVIFGKNSQGEDTIIPWVSVASQATKIMASASRLTSYGYQMIFYYDKIKPFENLIFYPHHQCKFLSDAFSDNKIFDIFKINDTYYILDPENKFFRPLYDGDSTEVISRDKSTYFYKMIKNETGDIIINSENRTETSEDSLFAVQYSLNGYFPVIDEILNDENNDLYLLSGRLFFKRYGRFYEAGLSTIRNQFMLSGKVFGYPSLMVGWDSLNDNFIAVKPYLKKSSSHIGETLESFVRENCKPGEKLEKFPTLLLSGAVSSESKIKLRILNYYYPLDILENGNFHLNCLGFQRDLTLKLQYDLFTESFELISYHQQNMSSNNDYVSPYDRLINQNFSKEKYPDISDLIDLNRGHINDELTMRIRQAAFLKRLHPIGRLDTLQFPLVQIYSRVLHNDTQSFQQKYPAAAVWMTWQRQLHLLLKSNLSNKLTLIEKIYLINDIENELFSSERILTNIKYTDNEAVWIDNDSSDIPQILRFSQRVYKNESLISEDGLIGWFPKAKYYNEVSVTQFMYEKDIHPRIMINKERDTAKVINSLFEEILISHYSTNTELEYFIISPNRQWMISIDDQQNVMLYDLYGRDSQYLKKNKAVIYAMNYSKLIKCSSEDYSLFLLSDSGVLFCPKNNIWSDNDGKKFLWAPPMNYFPAFISQDQRFLGFKYKDSFNTILYDQRNKQTFLLKRPSENYNNGNITAVSFSAMNAVLALAFDDGHIYLYDLIREQQENALSPMAHVKLNNVINNKAYNNILMRFEGFFDGLTIIHPEGIQKENKELDDVVFVRSRYGFHGDEE